MPSSTHKRLVPEKLLVTVVPVESGSSNVRSRGEVLRYERPVCQAVPVPRSPPTCVKTLPELTPFLLRGPAGPAAAGNWRPRPASTPTSQYNEVGATHLSWMPSSFNWLPRNTLFASDAS